MSVLSDLNKLKKPASRIDQWVMTLTEKDKEEWFEAVKDNEEYSTNLLHVFLNEQFVGDEKLSIGIEAVRRYRKKYAGGTV